MAKAVSAMVLVLLLVSVFSGAWMPTTTDETLSQESSNLVLADEFIHSYQFWNEYPMGMGNTTQVNQSGLLHLEARAWFHADGNLTVSVLMDSEVVFTETFRNATIYRVVPVSSGMTVITTASSGSHNASIHPIGDFYTVYAELHS